MNINLTLFGEMITFLLFVGFTMKYVWPPLQKVLDDRKKEIADGLSAAEKGHNDLERSKELSIKYIKDAKQEASKVIDSASERSVLIIEKAKQDASIEGERIVNLAKKEIDGLYLKAKIDIKKQIVDGSLYIAKKILQDDMDENKSKKLAKKMVEEII